MSMLPHMPERRLGRLQRPDCSIHYEVTGSGPPLLFLHGLGGNQLSWWQQVAHFSKTHTCVAFATRGFAPSSPLPGGPDPKDYAGDVAALIEHLGLSSVVLIGQSMGGWGSIEYAVRHKANVRAIVLAATTGTIDVMQIEGPERARLEPWMKQSAEAAAEFAGRGIHVACGAAMATEQPALHLLYRHIDDMNASLDKNALREKLWHARVRKPAELAEVGCPVLFVSGDDDVVIPPFAADALARAVPRSRVVHFASTGHSAYFERAEAFNKAVAAFLAEI